MRIDILVIYARQQIEELHRLEDDEQDHAAGAALVPKGHISRGIISLSSKSSASCLRLRCPSSRLPRKGRRSHGDLMEPVSSIRNGVRHLVASRRPSIACLAAMNNGGHGNTAGRWSRRSGSAANRTTSKNIPSRKRKTLLV